MLRYQTLLTVLTIIAGGFFFDEFSVMPPKDLVWFSFGVAVSLSGVAMHSLHRASVDPDAKGLSTAATPSESAGEHWRGDTATTQADETALTPGRLQPRLSGGSASTERSSLISTIESPGL